jgi:5-methylcytosine-specific restriction endonuclease McrA
MKMCTVCKKEKPFDQYGKNASLKSGLNSACRECMRVRSKTQYRKHADKRLAEKAAYREQHREQLKLNAREYRKRAWDINKKWRNENRDKIKETAARRRQRIREQKVGVIPMAYIERLLRQPCFYCGGEATEIDHVIPIVRGGKHSIGNIVSSCQTCNQHKSTRLLIEWKAIGKC